MSGSALCALRRLSLSTALLLPALAAASAAAQDGVEGARLRAGGVITAAGEVALPLGSGETLTQVAGGADGWFAAGVQTAVDHGLERARLSLWRGAASSADALPVPATTGRWLGSPCAVTRVAAGAGGGDLVGLAWLEGGDPEAAAVRWSAWNGAGWGETVTVSAAGPGSQLGLGASRLDDGRVLLVWSRYDGEDDEIYWSLGEAGRFSQPVRLEADDRVPDMTPAVTAVPGGALAAWSAFDRAAGQYRVMSARFDGAAWGAAEPLGPVGSLYPSFEPSTAARPLVLYRTAAPRGWQLVELDTAGRATRRASAAAVAPERPSAALARGAPVLHFAAGERTLGWESLRLEVAP